MTLGTPGRIAVDRPQEREVVRGIRRKTIGIDGRIRGRDRDRDQGPFRIRATIPVIIVLVLLRLDHAVVQRRTKIQKSLWQFQTRFEILLQRET